MELGVYGADGVLEGEGELEYRNVTELSKRVGGLSLRGFDGRSGGELQSLLFDWPGERVLVGDTDVERAPVVELSSFRRLEWNF